MPTKPKETDLKNLILEGSAASVMGSLAGGAFLTGYALYLGCNDFQIGLLSSLPPIATTIQLLTHFLVRRPQDRKNITLWTIGFGRLLWLVIAMLPVIFLKNYSVLQYTIILTVIIVSTGASSVGGITWWSWVSDLIPRNMFGSYFSRRNLWCGLAGIVSFYAATIAMDVYKDHTLPIYHGYGFAGLFFIGVVFGMISIVILKRIPDHAGTALIRKTPSFHEILLPLKDRDFRVFIWDRSLWTLSVFIAAPYFNVYLLKYLHSSWQYIGFLSALATIASLYCIKFWGRLIDQFGNKPILIISCYVKALFPFIWVFATPANYMWLLIIPYLICVFDSAINLTSGNLALKLSPQSNNAAYLAAYTTCINLAAAISPLLGGWFLTSCTNVDGMINLPYLGSVHGMKILFFLSAGMRVFSSNTLSRMHEPDTRSIRHMFRVLKEVKGVVPTVSEWDQAFRFWFSPLDEMMDTIRERVPFGKQSRKKKHKKD